MGNSPQVDESTIYIEIEKEFTQKQGPSFSRLLSQSHSKLVLLSKIKKMMTDLYLTLLPNTVKIPEIDVIVESLKTNGTFGHLEGQLFVTLADEQLVLENNFNQLILDADYLNPRSSMLIKYNQYNPWGTRKGPEWQSPKDIKRSIMKRLFTLRSQLDSNLHAIAPLAIAWADNYLQQENATTPSISRQSETDLDKIFSDLLGRISSTGDEFSRLENRLNTIAQTLSVSDGLHSLDELTLLFTTINNSVQVGRVAETRASLVTRRKTHRVAQAPETSLPKAGLVEDDRRPSDETTASGTAPQMGPHRNAESNRADYDGSENFDSDESQIADFNFDSSDRSSPGLHQQGISLTSEHLREINDDRAEAERSSIRHAELNRENSGDSISKDPGYLAWRAGNDLIDQNSRGGSRIDTRRATREVISTVEGPTGVQVSSLNAHAVDIAPPPGQSHIFEQVE